MEAAVTDGHNWVLRATGIYFHSSGDEKFTVHGSVVFVPSSDGRGEVFPPFLPSWGSGWSGPMNSYFQPLPFTWPPDLYVSLNLSCQTPVLDFVKDRLENIIPWEAEAGGHDLDDSLGFCLALHPVAVVKL